MGVRLYVGEVAEVQGSESVLILYYNVDEDGSWSRPRSLQEIDDNLEVTPSVSVEDKGSLQDGRFLGECFGLTNTGAIGRHSA